MKKFTFTLLALCIVSSAFAAVELVDEPMDLLQDAIDRHHKTIKASMDEEDLQYAESFSKILGNTNFMCTGGLDPNAITKKEYLTAFKAGPCNPVVILPGIGGSKLRVEINCKKFKAADPAGFDACGWKRCLGLQVPKKEYKVWIPAAFAPMSIMIDSDKSRKCFQAVFGFDSTNISSGHIKMADGLTVSVEGTTKESRSKADSNCAASAIEDLLTTGVQANGSAYFKKFRIAFEGAGYVTGLTYQALPYDFRIDYKENALNTRFKGILKEMSDNWGKRVVIYAHSFGNLQTVHNLSKMTQGEKDRMVARYIALAPPFLGAPKTVEGQIGLDNTFTQDLGFADLGITPAMYRHTIGLLKGLFNLMPKNTFKKFADEAWMKAIHARIEAEIHGHTITTGTVLDLLPQPTETCLPGFKSRDAFCNFGFVDMTVFGEVEGTSITLDNLTAIFQKYAVVEHSDKLWGAVQDPSYDSLPNTGVQTNVIFTSALDTMYHFEFDENPKLKTDQDKYVAPTSNKYTYGDGTVLSTSAVVAALKWADDFEKKSPGAKPTTIIEVCSTKDRRTSVFSPDVLFVRDNAYFGIDCDCGGTKLFPKDGSKCGHTLFLTDPKVIEFLLMSAADGIASIETATSKAFSSKSESQIAAYEDSCQLLNNH